MSVDIRKACTNDIASLYAEEKAFHYVLQYQHGIVAMAGGFYKDDFPFCLYPNPVYGFIGDVFVNQSHRRQGMARKLSAMVMDEFKLNGMTEIRLLASEAARPVYTKLGFRDAEMMVKHV